MTPHDATESRPPLEPPDEQFLDELLDRLVEIFSDGRSADVSQFVVGREHLRARVLELHSLAREVTGVRDPADPEIDGYSILRKIGEGGMGAVYLARQERLGGRIVAVKVLPGHVASPRTRERFERESSALARLRHANIVTVHDVVPTAASCAYAMEWIEGCSLAEVLKHLSDEATERRSDERECGRLARNAAVGWAQPTNATGVGPLVRDSNLAPSLRESLPAPPTAASHTRERIPAEVRARKDSRTSGAPSASPSVASSLRRSVALPQSASWFRGRGSSQGSSAAAMDAVREKLQSPPGALPERSYVAFIANTGLSIARALSVVHAAGLLHRDVKPSNILLRRDGTPLLSDFGLVRETDATITQPGSFAGTPAYAPPEQLRGETDKLDARGDVYALGATLYHALALRLPLKGRNPAELLRQIERAGPPPLRKLNPKLPVDLETIVSKAMEPDPARRYQSAAELSDDLERLLTLQPIRARPAGLVTRSIKLVRRNRGAFVGLVAGGLSALAVATLLVVYFVLMPRWVAEHTRAARLALLDPRQANDIVSVLYWGRINRQRAEEMAKKIAKLEAALDNYDAALGLAPLDAELRAERDTVAAARETVGWALPTIARVPDDARYAKPRVPEVTSGMVGNAHPTSPRANGLYAFLNDDYETAIREWTAYESARDPLAAPDPLVSAALGVLYLFDDQPGRAYPRLRDAVRAFPNVAFLTTYLADAALKCGDAADAGRLLAQAASQPHADPYNAAQRVQAGLLAAAGKFTEAEQAYRAISNPGPNILDLGRLLEGQGRIDEAMDTFLIAARLGGSVPLRVGRAALERWWLGLTSAQRLSEIRSSLDHGTYDQRSLAARLRTCYPSSRQFSARAPARWAVFPPSLRRFLAPSLFLEFFPTLFAAVSSPSIQSLSLSELANRMEVHDMSLWNRVTPRPRVLKDLHYAKWRWTLLRLTDCKFRGICTSGHSWLCATWQATIGAVMLLGTPAISFAQNCPNAPCFQGLGDLPGGAFLSNSYRMSRDGLTVVGQSISSSGQEAFIWRAETGMQGLGDLPGGVFFSRAEDVSADGNVVAGSSDSANSAGWLEGFRWTNADGLTGLGDLPGDVFNSRTRGMSDDGSRIVGYADGGSGSNAHAFLWTSAGIQALPGGGTGSIAFAISADGSVIYGLTGPDVNASAGMCRWTSNVTFQYLGDFSPGVSNLLTIPYATTDHGDIVVGYACTNNCTAFEWTETAGFVELGGLAGSGDGRAFAISPDGRLIGGYSGPHAVLWDNERQVIRVVDELATKGVAVPPGWALNSVFDIAVNGEIVTLCGRGTNPQGNPEAWIARYTLPAPPCPGDINGDGVVDLLDLTLLLAAFGSSSGGPGFNAAADFDGNGSIDLSDLTTLLAAFGTSCP